VLFNTSEIKKKIQVQQSVVTCSCASCGFGMCTVFYLYPLVFYVCIQFLFACAQIESGASSPRDCKSQGCSGI
jgi:hypothetical protein